MPSPDAPCLECGWDSADYAAVDQSYPCARDTAGPRTAAPSALAALAASLQAIECDKVLAGQAGDALVGRDVLIDTRHHKHYVTSTLRNPACRMPDHAGWRIDPIAATASTITFGDVVALGSALRDASRHLALSVAGQRFAVALTCPVCGGEEPTFRLERVLHRSPHPCPACHGEMRPTGFGLRDEVLVESAPSDALDAPLASLGLRAGDVLSMHTPSVEVHYELGGEP
jgi:hypothetical protein